MNRRELLKLTCGALFAPLLKWLPQEKVIVGVDPAQGRDNTAVAVLRQFPDGDMEFGRPGSWCEWPQPISRTIDWDGTQTYEFRVINWPARGMPMKIHTEWHEVEDGS